MCPVCTNVWVRDVGNYRYPVEKIGKCPTQYGKEDPRCNIKGCDIVQAAVVRYKDRIFQYKRFGPMVVDGNSAWSKNSVNQSKVLMNLKIDFSGKCEKYPSETMNEMYELKIATPDIHSKTALLVAKSPWGVLRGLETFSQLVTYTEDSRYEIQGIQIFDFPRFAYRGFMLDTSRHFLSKSIIKKNLELMEQSKMNVFHWHITDDPSFPFQSIVYPQLSNKGAFNKNTHIYKPSDVTDIIEFARIRGIRVIPEFDTPGHTESWGKGVKNLLTPCYETGTGKISGYYAINPILNSTYEFLENFFGEVVKVFNDQYLHLGGDELSFDCWKSNPDLNKFMKEKNYTEYSQLEDYYEQKLVDIIKSFPGDHQYMVWEEVFLNGVKLRPESIIHVWRGGYKDTLAKATTAGFRTLLSSCWYLNIIHYGEDWPNYYKCDPQDFEGTQAQKNLIIGGEACMWGEYVDGTNVVSRSWPRASVPAERLWSDQNVTDITDANIRLNKFRCLLLRRGYDVEPPTGPGFCPDDYLVE
ncbi:Beta-hexosaminidase subunit alpha [Nymphon striatum]|nr:Beta-hexosaminidase subunit alpha [Nymphon striatum]